MARLIKGRGVISGRIQGQALVCPQGLTGWGGVDPASGRILDSESPLLGQSIKDRILVIPGSKGSNGWSCYFTATHVAGNGPRAMVVSRVDSSVGVALATMGIPAVVDCQEDPCQLIKTGDTVIVDGSAGTIEIINPA